MTALAIFARAPVERVKTRLRLEPARATRLYAAMLEDVVDTARRAQAELELWYANAMGPVTVPLQRTLPAARTAAGRPRPRGAAGTTSPSTPGTRSIQKSPSGLSQ